MGTLPQLIEEDIRRLDEILSALLHQAESIATLVIDQGGFLINSCGDAECFDFTTIAALASGAYMANETIAGLVHEAGFNSVYQQGDDHSLLILRIDESCLLVVIFGKKAGVGAVKYFAVPAARLIAAQLDIARKRNPDLSLDLSILNMADASQVFKKKG
jgi:predicted regulator of Ras-like GTPase activity (Roadblock/LC7/MglB family)